MSNDAALEQVLRELSDAATALEAAPGVVRQLRRRGLLRPPTSGAMLSSFSKRVTELLRNAKSDGKIAGTMLLQELLRSCEETVFAQHREAWCSSLLTMLSPAAAASAAGDEEQRRQAGQQHALQHAAALTLADMVGAAAVWPAQRREMSGAASRLVGALSQIVSAAAGEHGAQHGALVALLHLAETNPQTLRQRR
eukprot:6968314-Prymnesium_polylepis.1